MSAITEEMLIGDVIQAHPQTRLIFEMYGMGCILCMGAMGETVAGGAKMHGINVGLLVRELNRVIGADFVER